MKEKMVNRVREYEFLRKRLKLSAFLNKGCSAEMLAVLESVATGRPGG